MGYLAVFVFGDESTIDESLLINLRKLQGIHECGTKPDPFRRSAMILSCSPYIVISVPGE
jgi:hypothetical protein